MQERTKTIGQVKITHLKADGSSEVTTYPNSIVNTGRNTLAESILATTTPYSHIAAGSGTNPVAATDTSLQTELGRVAFTTSARVGNVVDISANFPPGAATGALTECGIFSSASGGAMFARSVFPVKNKGSGDTIVFSWTITTN